MRSLTCNTVNPASVTTNHQITSCFGPVSQPLNSAAVVIPGYALTADGGNGQLTSVQHHAPCRRGGGAAVARWGWMPGGSCAVSTAATCWHRGQGPQSVSRPVNCSGGRPAQRPPDPATKRARREWTENRLRAGRPRGPGAQVSPTRVRRRRRWRRRRRGRPVGPCLWRRPCRPRAVAVGSNGWSAGPGPLVRRRLVAETADLTVDRTD